MYRSPLSVYPLQELPSLAYQLLLLSTRGPKRIILKWRERQMRDDPEVRSLDHLRQVQVPSPDPPYARTRQLSSFNRLVTESPQYDRSPSAAAIHPLMKRFFVERAQWPRGSLKQMI
jgi:hypothetical protein